MGYNASFYQSNPLKVDLGDFACGLWDWHLRSILTRSPVIRKKIQWWQDLKGQINPPALNATVKWIYPDKGSRDRIIPDICFCRAGESTPRWQYELRGPSAVFSKGIVGVQMLAAMFGFLMSNISKIFPKYEFTSGNHNLFGADSEKSHTAYPTDMQR